MNSLFGFNRSNLVLCLFLSIFVLLVTSDVFFSAKIFQSLENKIFDLYFQRRGVLSTSDSLNVIIVSISNETLRELPSPYNKWPLQRNLYAKVIDNLNRAGAKAIGIDLIFEEGDDYFSLNDSLFIKSIKKYKNVILAGKINPMDERFKVIGTKEINFGNYYFFVDSSVGLVNVIPDEDGVLRSYTPFFYDEITNKFIPTFSFSLLNVYFDRDKFFVPSISKKGFNYGEIFIPIFRKNSFLVNYYGPTGTFTNINLVDVIDDKDFKTRTEIESGEEINTFDDLEYGLLYSDLFKNKIVLIGSTEPEDKDLFNIPISGNFAGKESNLMFGVEAHANVIQMVLDQNFLFPLSNYLKIFLIVLLTFVSFYNFNLIKKIKTKFNLLMELLGIIILIVFEFLLYKISYHFFVTQNLVIGIVPLSFSILGGYLGSTIQNYLHERKQRQMIKGMFSQYLNPEVVNYLIKNPSELKLGGIRKELTVMFTDLENFTRISEILDPETLVQRLNEYFEGMSEEVFKTKGTLDKFEGDAIMAFWGAPFDDHNHAINACLTAIAIKKKTVQISRRWEEALNIKISTRIGINTGIMIVGNMGGTKKFDYTVMGDNVNLAARLESVNKIYGTNIIINETTYDKIKDNFFTRELDYILVKGKTIPVRIYELIDINENINDENKRIKEYFERGLELYRNRKFAQAIEEFEKVLLIVPDDKPSLVFIDRCFKYLNVPPPNDWSGIYELKIK